MPADVTTRSALLLLALAVIGLVNCFAGYRLFRVMLVLFGAMLGAAIGHALGAATGSAAMGVILAVVGGLILGALTIGGYYAGVGLLGAYVFGSAAVLLLGGTTEAGRLVTALVAGVIGGALAMVLQRAVITFGTAVHGALMAVLAIVVLIGGGGVDRYESLYGRIVTGTTPPGQALGHAGLLAVWAVLALAGILLQAVPRRERRKTIFT